MADRASHRIWIGIEPLTEKIIYYTLFVMVLKLSRDVPAGI
jgi:hypothetical protein